MRLGQRIRERQGVASRGRIADRWGPVGILHSTNNTCSAFAGVTGYWCARVFCRAALCLY